MKKQLATMAALLAATVLGAACTAVLPGCGGKARAPVEDITRPDTSESMMTNGSLFDEPVEVNSPDVAPGEPSEQPEPKESKEPAEEPKEPAEPKEPTEEPKEPAAEPAKPSEEPKTDAPKDEPKAKPADEPGASAGTSANDEAAARAAAVVDKSSNPQIKPGDWAQWGGTSYRNNTPIGRGIPIEWDTGGFDRKTGEWLKDKAVNIKWVSPVGSQTYGNPVVSGGKVFIGTNNGYGHLKRYPGNVDLGVLLCFDEKDGKLLWQHSSEKLPTGRVHDWPLQGICCAPVVEGDRLWFVTSRGEVRCLDVNGYHDGKDDGDIKNEWARMIKLSQDGTPDAVAGLKDGKLTDTLRAALKQSGAEIAGDIGNFAADGERKWTFTGKVGEAERKFEARMEGPSLSVYKQITPDDTLEADTLWSFNMMTELGSSQHNMCSCSVTSLGDILFVNTSNGLDETHILLPAPNAPSFFAMDKNTGEVLWTDKSPGENVLHGQWSSPAVGTLGGVPQVIFAGGDGWVYSFRADRGKDGKPELLWKFDANPKQSKWILGGRGTRNNIIATPVIYDGLVYVAVGQDPEHGEGEGHLWCLDPHKRGDVSPEFVVKRDAPDKHVPHRRIQALLEEEGEIAVPNKNSAVIWHYSKFDQNGDGEIDYEEEMHRSCGTVAIKNDLLFISDFSGLFHCLDAKSGKVHWTYDMLAQAWGSPLIVEDHVYIGDEDGDVAVFNLTKEKHEPISEVNMGNSVYSTPIVANDVLFISNRTHLFAIKGGSSDAKGAE